jgi:hypothetical protein
VKRKELAERDMGLPENRKLKEWKSEDNVRWDE